MDYFIRMWVRPRQPFQSSNLTNGTQTQGIQVFLEIQGAVRCFINYTNSSLGCSFYQASSQNSSNCINVTNCTNNYSVNTIWQNLSDISYQPIDQLIPNSTWIHVSLGGSVSLNQTYLRLDLQDQQMQPTSIVQYLPIAQNSSQWNAYLGTSMNTTLYQGFIGDIREFLFTQQFVNATQVANIRNQVIYWNTTQIGNYRMQGGDLTDFNRPYNQTASLLNSTNPNNITAYPTWAYDSSPIDMCKPSMSYTYLPLINSSAMNFSNPVIDSRLQPTTNFSYAASFWLQTVPAINTASTFQLSQTFFDLAGVFGLWFSAPTQIMMQIHAMQTYYEQSSNPIYFPIGQWANLQISISRVNGIDMRVYDLQRRQVARVTQALYLMNQQPNGVFTLFKNYRGYAKQIMLYMTGNTLPLDSKNGQFGSIVDSTLLLYYKFDSQYLTSTQQNVTNLPNLASYQVLGNNYYGPSVTISGAVAYQTLQWDQTYTFSQPSPIGTLTQPFSIYDGIACQKNVTLLYRANSTNSSITYVLNTTQTNISSATVEFWFKRLVAPSQNQTNFLFSLFSPTLMKEYFAIYQQTNDSLLTCQPFDSMSNSSPSSNISVKYRDYNQSITTWQHVFCKFEANYDLIASIYKGNAAQSRFYNTDLSTISTSLTYIHSNSIIVIGNRYNATLGQNSTYFKEVRFWASSRTIQQLELYRFAQIDPNRASTLLAYFKLTSGASTIVNYATLIQNESMSYATISQGVIQEQEILTSDNITVCPQYSFQNQLSCSRNPFTSHSLLLYPTGVSTNFNQNNQTSIQWLVTSQYSGMTSEDSRNQLNKNAANESSYSWILSQQNLPQLQFTWNSSSLPFSFTQGTSQVIIEQSVTNAQRTFNSYANLQVTPHPCQFIAPQNYTSLGIYEQYLTTNPGNTSITLTFQLFDYCPYSQTSSMSSAASNIMQNYAFNTTAITWTILPSNPQVNLVPIYSKQLGCYTATLASTGLASIPQYQSLYLIGQFQWNSTIKNSGSSQNVLQHIVYKIKYVEQFNPVITVANNQVLIGEPVIISGANSSVLNSSMQNYSNAESVNDIAYYWTCPQQFQSACVNQKNKKYLTIAYSDFAQLTSGSYNTPYQFQLQVFKGTDPDVNLSLIPSVSQSVSWLKIFRPAFVLSSQNPSQILASTNNSFRLDFSNYDYTDANLVISWSLSPNSSDDTLITVGQYLNNYTLGSGCLDFNTTYTLTVTVQHAVYAFANSTSSYVFTTGLPPPVEGIAIANPGKAIIAMNTPIKFSISKWISPVPSSTQKIKFVMSGYTAAGSSIQLVTTPVYQDSSITIVIPNVNTLVFYVSSDDTAEFTIFSMPMNITSNQSSVSINSTYDPTLSFSQQQAQLTYFANMIFEVNQWNTSPANDVKSSILQYLSSISTQNTLNSSQAAILMSFAVRIGNMISVPSAGSSSSVLGVVVNFANTVLSSGQAVLQQAIQNGQFTQSFSSMVSNLLQNQLNQNQQSIVNMQKFQQGSLTNSQQYIAQLLSIKQQFSNLLCSQATPMIQQNIQTDGYQLIIEQVPQNTLVFNKSYIYSQNVSNSIMIPLQNVTKTYNQSVCLQVTYYTANPLSQWSFSSQSFSQPSNPVVMELSALWNGQVTPTTNPPILNISLGYNYNVSGSDFKHNQTVIEILPSNYVLQNGASWNYYNSQYNVSQQLMQSYSQIDLSQTPSFFVGIVTDLTRTEIIDSPSFLAALIALIMNFDDSVIPVLLFLILFNIILPVFVICKDKRDYNAVDNFKSEGGAGNNFLEQIAIKKVKSLKEVSCSRNKYLEYAEYDEALTFTKTFSLYFKNLHPLASVISLFDYEYKRLSRFTIISFQISIVAILCGIIFSDNVYRVSEQDNPERETTLDSLDVQNAFIVGVILALLTLPVPQSLICCLKSPIKSITKKSQSEQFEGGEAEHSDRLSHSNNSQEADGAGEDNFQRRNKKDQVQVEEIPKFTSGKATKGSLKDEDVSEKNQTSIIDDDIDTSNHFCSICLKLLFAIICLVFVLTAILLVAIVSSLAPSANSQALTLAFFLAILIGHLIYNTIRVAINAVYAPTVVEELNSDEQQFDHCNGIKCCHAVFIAPEAINILQDLLIVYDVKQSGEGIFEKVSETIKGDHQKVLQTDRTQKYEVSAIDEEDQISHTPNGDIPSTVLKRGTPKSLGQNVDNYLLNIVEAQNKSILDDDNHLTDDRQSMPSPMNAVSARRKQRQQLISPLQVESSSNDVQRQKRVRQRNQRFQEDNYDDDVTAQPLEPFSSKQRQEPLYKARGANLLSQEHHPSANSQKNGEEQDGVSDVEKDFQ